MDLTKSVISDRGEVTLATQQPALPSKPLNNSGTRSPQASPAQKPSCQCQWELTALPLWLWNKFACTAAPLTVVSLLVTMGQ